MTINTGLRLGVAASAIASAVALSGCVSSPTYGTDKTSTEQLVGDLSGILSVQPKRGEPIDYKPRPELVRPASTDALPEPQDNVVTASAEWPESPEQQRARLRAEATENRDKPGFEPTVVGDLNAEAPGPKTALGESPAAMESGLGQSLSGANARQQREEVKRRLAETRQGSTTRRKYLSEPPLDYRKPNETAPVDDIGEDEWKKERRLKAEARKAAGKSSWRDLIPGM